MHPNLSVERRGGVATLSVTRPPVNALTLPLLESLAEELHLLADDASIGVAIWRSGLAGVFSGGYDPHERPGPGNGLRFPVDAVALLRDAQQALLEVPFPIVAAVNGEALGLGMLLPLRCDVAVAASSARFGLREDELDAIGGPGSAAEVLPEPALRYLLRTGRRVPPEYLHQYGLIARIVDDDRLDAEARSIAGEIAAHGPVAVRNSKLALEALRRLDSVPPADPIGGTAGAVRRIPTHARQR